MTAADAAELEASVRTISETIATMKALLYGSPNRPVSKEAGIELMNEVLRTDLLRLFVRQLPLLRFEARKDVVHVFSNLLRKHRGGEPTTANWLEANPDVLLALLSGYADPQVALHCGMLLRECIRHERLAAILLPHAPSANRPFYELFRYVESPLFDVASDAFATLKDLLTRHKPLASAFLRTAYAEFFAQYGLLLHSENYVTRRQSLKLLAEILLDRSNFAVMSRYISSADHLKSAMILLRDPSSSVQIEAFHVFKIFAANPRKEGRVLHVLQRNREKLVAFLQSFQNDKADEQFVEEKRFLIAEISRIGV